MARKKIREYDSKRCGHGWLLRCIMATHQLPPMHCSPEAAPTSSLAPASHAARRLLKAHIARLAGLQLPIHVAQVKENTNFSELVSGAGRAFLLQYGCAVVGVLPLVQCSST